MMSAGGGVVVESGEGVVVEVIGCGMVLGASEVVLMGEGVVVWPEGAEKVLGDAVVVLRGDGVTVGVVGASKVLGGPEVVLIGEGVVVAALGAWKEWGGAEVVVIGTEGGVGSVVGAGVVVVNCGKFGKRGRGGSFWGSGVVNDIVVIGIGVVVSVVRSTVVLKKLNIHKKFSQG